MIKYEKQILDVLLDKYERSKSFIGANQVTQSFTLKVEQLFPKYTDDSEYELFCAVNESIKSLEKQGFIKTKSQKNGVIQRVTLNVGALNSVYKYINRTPKSDIVDDLKKLLFAYKDANEILSAYCNRQIERLESNKSVEFFDDLVSYELILESVSKITNIEIETFERDFSVRVLGDSKAFEKIRTKVVSLL